MNAIEVDAIRKCYGEFCAVDDLSFAVEQGEVFGLCSSRPRARRG